MKLPIRLSARTRLRIEILLAIGTIELTLTFLLGALGALLSPAVANVVNAVSLMLLMAPFVFWRSAVLLVGEQRTLASALHQSDTALVLMDTGMRIQWANDGFCRMTGYSSQEIIGCSTEDLLTNRREQIGVADPSGLEGDDRPLKTRRRLLWNERKDGEHYWTNSELRPEFSANGKLIGYIELFTDITELMEAKEELRTALRDAKSMWDGVSTHTIVSVADRNGRILEANDAFCAISGYVREELIGKDHRVLNSGHHEASYWADMWDSISHGRPWRGEIKNRRKDGSHYWVNSLIVPYLGSDGMVEKYVSVRMDITDRMRAEESLQDALRDARSMWDAVSTHAIVSVADRSGRIIEANSHFCEISGYSREELIGQDHRLLNSGYHYPSFWIDMWEHISRGEPWHGEIKNRRKDGSHYWVSSVIAPYMGSDGLVEKYVSIRMDVTDRILFKQSLRLAQERVKVATESAGIGIWIFNPTTLEQNWDEQQYRIFGIDPIVEKHTPTYELWSRSLHPEDAGRAKRAFEAMIQEGARYTETFRIVRPDGKIRYVSSLGVPQFDEAGKIQYVVGVNQDVTESVQQAMDLKEARDAAEKASQIKSQFLANVSHELRTPMTGIIGILKLLQSSGLEPEHLDFVRKANMAAQSMNRLVDDVLDFSKYETDALVLERNSVSLEEMLYDVTTGAVTDQEGKNLDVLLDVDADLPQHIVGDRKRLRQVLHTLLNNAVRFTNAGYVLCRVTRLRKVNAPDQIEFSVEDTGIGIAPELLDHIFEGFSQVESSDTREYGGMGLSLGLAKRLVDLMGGRLSVISTLGQGSRFSFAVQLHASADADTHDADEPHVFYQALASFQSALIVDEVPVSRLLTKNALESLGIPVSCCEDVQSLGEMVHERQRAGKPCFDLVLWNWSMSEEQTQAAIGPFLDFYASQGLRAPVMVAMVRHGSSAFTLGEVYKKYRFNGFVMKPFTAQLLAQTIDQCKAVPLVGATPAAKQHIRRLKGLRVLVVEDMPLTRQILYQMLQKEGALVSMAENGLLGVEAMQHMPQSAPFGVVLMDIQMPVMDGYTACRKIRQDLKLTDIPILAVTANTHELDKHKCAEAGMTRHIGKPFDLDNLVKIIQEVTGIQADDTDHEVLPQEADRGHGATAVAGAGTGTALDAASPDAQAEKWTVNWNVRADLSIDGEMLAHAGIHLQVDDGTGLVPVVEPSDASPLPGAILVADSWEVCRDTLHLHAGRLGNTAVILLADSPSDALLESCLKAGVQDVVAPEYARRYLPDLVQGKLGPEGGLLSTSAHLDQVLKTEEAMGRMQADHAFFGSILEAFLIELPTRLAQIKAGWIADAEEVARDCHSLKGMSYTFGLVRLGKVTLEMERYVKACRSRQEKPADEGLLLRLETEMQSSRYYILRWFAQNSEATTV